MQQHQYAIYKYWLGDQEFIWGPRLVFVVRANCKRTKGYPMNNHIPRLLEISSSTMFEIMPSIAPLEWEALEIARWCPVCWKRWPRIRTHTHIHTVVTVATTGNGESTHTPMCNLIIKHIIIYYLFLLATNHRSSLLANIVPLASHSERRKSFWRVKGQSHPQRETSSFCCAMVECPRV